MVHARRLSAVCGLLALCSAFTLKASADTFTKTGTLANDNSVVEITFTTATAQTYDFYTTSYAGGTNADGTTTASGGFDPVLSLFNADGTLFTGYMNNPANSASDGGSDANLVDVLGPGTYTLALSEFPNYSAGTLASFSGIGTLVSDACGASPAFTDPVSCTTLNGNYAVNYSSTPVSSSAVTPEPPSALLLLLPLGGVVFLNRRKLAHATSL